MAVKHNLTKRHRVITVGPDTKGLGGIASLLSTYRKLWSDITYATSNSRHGTLPGLFLWLWVMIRIPFYRLRGYDIIHAHGAVGKSFIRKSIILSWGRLFGFKTIFHSHGGAFRDYAAAVGESKIKKILHRCDAIVALTAGWQKYFTETMECPVVRVVNNIVEAPETPVERSLLPEGRPINFLFLGKVCENKGVYDILKALTIHRDWFEGKIKVTVCGNGEFSTFVSKVKELALDSMVHYAGCVFGKEKDALLRESDVMLLPSYFEGLPIVLLEAGVYAMPSVATDVGGITELIENGVNGTIVKPGDVESLAEAMRSYIDDHNKILSRGREARRIVADYSSDAVKDALQRLYDEID